MSDSSPLNTVRHLRLRYIIGLSVIAVLITASNFVIQKVIADQRDYSQLVSMAGHQAGLANRIAYFAGQMVSTSDESEYAMALSQVGLTIGKMKSNHRILRHGSPEDGLPLLTNDNLEAIYDSPQFGLNKALLSFLDYASEIAETDKDQLSKGSMAYLYLTTYGPHVLEPLLDAAVDQYESICTEAIKNIERIELLIWIATLITLLFEVALIFRPFERQIRRTFSKLESSISALQATRSRLITAQAIAEIGDWQLDLTRHIFSCSDQVNKICGTTDTGSPISYRTAMQLVHPDDRIVLRRSILTLLRNKQKHVELEYRLLLPHGEIRIIYQQAVLQEKSDADGKNPQQRVIIGTVQDITQRRELYTRLERLSENTPGFLFQYLLRPDGRSRFPYASHNTTQTIGLAPAAVHENSEAFFSRIHVEDRIRIMNSLIESGTMLSSWHEQYRVLHPLKGEIWLESHATPQRLHDGATLWHGYTWDISETKRSEDQIRKLALFDPLTGLANRRLLKDRLQHALSTSRRNGNFGAVLMLDLDNFKSLNDTQGHNVGDALLIEVAKRLQRAVRETDTISRLGGDEFVVILEWLGKDEEESCKRAMEIAEKIRMSINQAYLLDRADQGKHTHRTAASIGLTLFNRTGCNESELLKRADIAMYEAKDSGRNKVCLFSERRMEIINRRTAMAYDLQQALTRDEFEVYFQPQLRPDGRICGAEALLRWFPKGKKPISPAIFIPVAEETGMIQPLGEWVLGRTCRHLNELCRSRLPDGFAVAVNISALQFSDELFYDKLRRLFMLNNLDTRRLKLELTESCLMQDTTRGVRVLSDLRRLGVKVELDDFGTGYSSLISINKLPLDTLKLDSSLIHGVQKDRHGKAIVRAAIAMAKALTLEVVAEGVENKVQNDFLIAEGCDMLQGFYYAKPMSFEKFREYLRTSREAGFTVIPPESSARDVSDGRSHQRKVNLSLNVLQRYSA